MRLRGGVGAVNPSTAGIMPVAEGLVQQRALPIGKIGRFAVFHSISNLIVSHRKVAKLFYSARTPQGRYIFERRAGLRKKQGAKIMTEREAGKMTDRDVDGEASDITAGHMPPRKIAPLVLRVWLIWCLAIFLLFAAPILIWPDLVQRLASLVIQPSTAQRRIACSNNLKQIALALHSYAEAYKSFPPAYIADKNGRPMHSWRTLLLPFFDDPSLKSLYDRYRFDEPWDSPLNREVTNVAIGLFQCPSQPDVKDPITSYMMVVGPHTISDGPQGRTFGDIKDGLAHTILIVEVADSGTWWAEPEDLHFDQMGFKINNSKRQGISSYHAGGANVAFCDGAVQFLPDATNPELVKAMLTIDGGEHAVSQ